MKNRSNIVSFVVLIMFLCGVGPTLAQGPAMPVEKPMDPEYTKLIDKLKSNDTAIDYKALRLSFAKSGSPGLYRVDPKLRMKLVESMKAKKYDEIGKTAQEMLKINFLDLNVHAYAAAAYENLKDAKKHAFHQAVYLGLINSIVSSSSGESAKTAYVVVSPDEIIAVLNAFELSRTGIEPLTEGTSRYEVVTAADKASGATSKVYFNVDLMPKAPEKPAAPAKQ